MSNGKTVWHYTTALGFLPLLQSGKVDVSSQDTWPGERPVAWFSANPLMEFTIRELAYERSDGTYLRSKTAADYRIFGLGLYRVSASTDDMLRYVDLLKAAKVGGTRRRKLEHSARVVGANPFEWYGRLTPLPLDESLGLERFDGTRWVPLQREGAADLVLAEQDAVKQELTALIASRRSDRAPGKAQPLF